MLTFDFPASESEDANTVRIQAGANLHSRDIGQHELLTGFSWGNRPSFSQSAWATRRLHR